MSTLPTEVKLPDEAPRLSPIQFKLLFTPAERVAMDAAKGTDPVLKDFFSIVDDPRLTYVDLGLDSTKQAIQYLVDKQFINAVRAGQILSGTSV
jgi:hypothetical protein